MSDDLITGLQAQLQAVIAQLDGLTAAPASAAPPPLAAAAVAAEPNPGFEAEGAFYDWLRDNDMLGPKISPNEFRGCDAISRACAAAQWPVGFVAYALGTAYLETNHQMLPVREAYWLSDSAAANYFRRMYDPQGARPDVAARLGNTEAGDGALFCGRGYVQLTGRTNYAKFADALGVDLIAQPDLALDPAIAARIMIRGMAEGTFTGRKLADYLPAAGPATLDQLTPARHIINGSDRESDVAGFAANFQQALEAGKWKF